MNDVIKRLGYPLHTEAIQRTKDKQTHKGYDTDGYGYQFCVNRLNEELGAEWGFSWEVIHEEKNVSKSGNQLFDITVRVDIWISKKDNSRSCVGNHISKIYGDALKGAITNGLKKTAAFWGVGRQAYEGRLDDDNDPYPDWIAQQSDEQPENEKPASQQQSSHQPKVKPVSQSHSSPSQDHEKQTVEGQQPATGNGREVGLRGLILAKLEVIFDKSREAMAKWLKSFGLEGGVESLNTLNAEQLEKIRKAVDKKFEDWKVGRKNHEWQ